jgi:hypothetical protein
MKDDLIITGPFKNRTFVYSYTFKKLYCHNKMSQNYSCLMNDTKSYILAERSRKVIYDIESFIIDYVTKHPNFNIKNQQLNMTHKKVQKIHTLINSVGLKNS